MTKLYVAVAGRPFEEEAGGLPRPSPNAMVGLPPLDEDAMFRLRVLAVDSALHHLEPVASAAGLEMPSATNLVEQGSNLRGDAGCYVVAGLHTEVAEILGAANPQAGKAYELGTALATLCEATKGDAKAFANAVNQGRIDSIRFLIEGLQSVLPAHSAQAVKGALNNWEDWMAARDGSGQPIQWVQEGPDIALALAAQGVEWFALLGGQKDAVDLLSAEDYVDAGEGLLRQYRKLGGRFLAQWWPWVTVGFGVAAGIIALFLIFGRGDTRGIGTIVTFVASLGITAKTVTSTLEKTASNVEDSLWEAELDNAIVYAATTLPEGATPLVSPVTRPLQRAQRLAAQKAVAGRQQAVADRTAQRAHAASAARTPTSSQSPPGATHAPAGGVDKRPTGQQSSYTAPPSAAPTGDR